MRALRIPQTPTTLTFAKLVTQQPEQVATALRALESALPDSDDPRIHTLRTLAAFVGNLDPESPTFAAQVTSYISHVIEGPEQKLAMLRCARASLRKRQRRKQQQFLKNQPRPHHKDRRLRRSRLRRR